jgi:multidrug efflux pump subunit AcrB
MAHGRSDAEAIRDARNVPRFFVERRPIAWIALVAVVLWGLYGYFETPKRKDPDIAVRIAVAITPWPG